MYGSNLLTATSFLLGLLRTKVGKGIIGVAAWSFAPFLGWGQMGQPLPGGGLVSLKDIQQQLESRDAQDRTDRLKCGIECLYLLMRFHNEPCNLGDLERLVPIGSDGSSLPDLESAGRKMGLPLRCARFDPNSISRVPVPAIIHLEADGGFRHYVILLEVNERHVRLLDPTLNSFIDVSHRQFAQIATGYCLICYKPWFGPELVAVCVGIGALIVVLVVWEWRRKRPGSFASQQVSPKAFRSVVVALAINGSVLSLCVGCQNREEGIVRAASSRPRQLEVDQTDIDLGIVPGGSEVEGEFRFRNCSSSPITLQLGAPSCTCLDAVLIPGPKLPPGASGEVRLRLSTVNATRAGRLQGSVLLGVEGSEENYALTLAGLLEGVAAMDPTYVLRKTHLESQKAPPLRLELLTREKDANFAISSVFFRQPAQYFPVVAGGEGGGAHLIAGPKIENIEAKVKQLEVGEPQYLNEQAVFKRELQIPVLLSGVPSGRMGEVEVNYQLKATRGIYKVRFVVVSD
jgi:hypothetical protein